MGDWNGLQKAVFTSSDPEIQVHANIHTKRFFINHHYPRSPSPSNLNLKSSSLNHQSPIFARNEQKKEMGMKIKTRTPPIRPVVAQPFPMQPYPMSS